MKKINLQSILFNVTYENPHGDRVYFKDDIIKAMKEACKQVLELAAEKAVPYILPTIDKNWVVGVNKQSITNTINQVE